MIQEEVTTAGRRDIPGSVVDPTDIRHEGQAMGLLQSMWGAYTESERKALQDYHDIYTKKLRAEQESLTSEIGRAGRETKKLTENIEEWQAQAKEWRRKAERYSMQRSKRRHARRMYRALEAQAHKGMRKILPTSKLNVERAGAWKPPEQQEMLSPIRGGEIVTRPGLQRATTTGMASRVPMEEAAGHLGRFQELREQLGDYRAEYDQDILGRSQLANTYSTARLAMSNLIKGEQEKVRKPLREAGWL